MLYPTELRALLGNRDPFIPDGTAKILYKIPCTEIDLETKISQKSAAFSTLALVLRNPVLYPTELRAPWQHALAGFANARNRRAGYLKILPIGME